jgi:uncharacterized membrane protein
MTGYLIGILALAYSGLVLFWLAHSLKKVMRPMRAALAAFILSVVVHSATLLMLEPEQVSSALALWGVPHLLLLPALLWSAWKQEKEGAA